jgi:hypothetical protein
VDPRLDRLDADGLVFGDVGVGQGRELAQDDRDAEVFGESVRMVPAKAADEMNAAATTIGWTYQRPEIRLHERVSPVGT